MIKDRGSGWYADDGDDDDGDDDDGDDNDDGDDDDDKSFGVDYCCHVELDYIRNSFVGIEKTTEFWK